MMKPNRRRPRRKGKTNKPGQSSAEFTAGKNGDPKRRRPPRNKGKPLTFEQICQRLEPRHEEALRRFARLARWWLRRTQLPGAESIVLESLVRAVFTFRSRARSKAERHKAMFHWVCRKIDFGLRNLAAEYPATAVRDAFIDFEQRFGYKPTLRQLSWWGGFNPRHVMNVWPQVAQELALTPETDTVMQSLVDEMGAWPVCGVLGDPASCDQVYRILGRLPPGDACLLILKDLCGFKEKEILRFLRRARQAASDSASQDDLEDLLDAFIGDRAENLQAPWDSSLLAIRTRSLLATRLSRARARCRAIYNRLFGSV